MAFLLAQGGPTLYKVDTATGTATALTLPTGVTLATSRKPKFAILDQWVIMVNSPSRNLAINAEGTVRVLVPEPPVHGPDVNAGTGTGLTGTWRWKVSFALKDSDGNILMESPLSDYYREVTLSNQDAAIGDIPISPDGAFRRIYRTLSGGTEVYYHLLDIDDNTTGTVNDATTDASLELLPVAATNLVAPPGTVPGVRLKAIVEWKSRAWAIANEPSLVDSIFVTETNKIYAWPHKLVAHPTGVDKEGVIGFAVRRNQLGFLKRNGLWMVSSQSGATGIDIDRLTVNQIAPDKAGCIAEDSILTINDRVYWLGRDGVYEWSDEGVRNMSNETVAPWFQTGTYFNRSRFANAFARYNELRNHYELHLAAAGSSVEDRWVSFNLGTRQWFGPHRTGAFTPSHAAHLVDADGLPITLVGGTDGVIYTGNSANLRDGAATAIDMDCIGPWHTGKDPDVEHYWGQLSLLTRVESAGTLTITPTVGRLDTVAGTAFTHDLTLGRELLERLGDGAICRLQFRKNIVNQGATIYGYEIDPVFAVGRR